MDGDLDPPQYAAAIVSCDIVTHSHAPLKDQLTRVDAINKIVRKTITSSDPATVVWCSGGDGGHVVFRGERWQQAAIDLIRDLHQWSSAQQIALRIAGHHGPLFDIVGADGRTQPVGEAINCSGWLLTQVGDEGVVVTDAFRREFEAADSEPPVHFHDSRFIPRSKSKGHLLHLMSDQEIRSQWKIPGTGDWAALVHTKDALSTAENGGWDVLYFAKRIWQVKVVDEDEDEGVRDALLSILPRHLRYRDATPVPEDINPILGRLQPEELARFLRLGQLVERRRGEFLCQYGEPGDTMFVILRGSVGVYNADGKGYSEEPEPRYVHRRGEIVGELAYALARNRTADLVALTDVALLSFNNNEVRSRLAGTKAGEAAIRQVDMYVNYRVLQHVSAYLLRAGRIDSAATGKPSWDKAMAKLRGYVTLIDIDPSDIDTPDFQVESWTVSPGPGRHSGVYILTRGTVTDSAGATLRSANFPVLRVDLPRLPHPGMTYRTPDEPIQILHIAAEGIDELSFTQKNALRSAFQQSIEDGSAEYEFDVFLCHSKLDEVVVREIYERLQAAGVRCWFDDDDIAPDSWITEEIDRGLAGSRFVLACLSGNFTKSIWAQRELRSRLHGVKQPDTNRLLVLMLNDGDNKDDIISPLMRDHRRFYYRKGAQFERLVEYIISSRTG
jgi:hypothetical protein